CSFVGRTAAEIFDRLSLWEDEALAKNLDWYRAVAANRKPAKFRIARTIPIAVSLDAPEGALWAELERTTPLFLDAVVAVRSGGAPLAPKSSRDKSLVELVVELAQRMLRHCNF